MENPISDSNSGPFYSPERFKFVKTIGADLEVGYEIGKQLGTRIYEAGLGLDPPRHMDESQRFSAYYMSEALRQIVGIGAKKHIFSPDKMNVQVPIFMRAEDPQELFVRGLLDYEATNDNSLMLQPPKELVIQVPDLKMYLSQEKFQLFSSNKEFLTGLKAEDLVPIISCVLRHTTGEPIEPSRVIWGDDADRQIIKRSIQTPLADDEDIYIDNEGAGRILFVQKEPNGKISTMDEISPRDGSLKATIEGARKEFNFNLLDNSNPLIILVGDILRSQAGYEKYSD
jgi:hypothetical protein